MMPFLKPQSLKPANIKSKEHTQPPRPTIDAGNTFFDTIAGSGVLTYSWAISFWLFWPRDPPPEFYLVPYR
jgi:hypothetical protein